MAKISELSPDGGSTRYELKDKDAQPKTLSTPIIVNGQSKTTVEGALRAINNKPSSGIDDTTTDTDNIMLVGNSEL